MFEESVLIIVWYFFAIFGHFRSLSRLSEKSKEGDDDGAQDIEANNHLARAHDTQDAS